MNTNFATTELLTIDPKEFVLQTYSPFTEELEKAIEKAPEMKYEISTTKGMEVAKEGRAMFRDIRIALEKKRAAAKAPILEIGKLLDSRAKEIAQRIEPFEERFDADIKSEEARKEAEKAAKARIEAERQARIQNSIDVIRNAPVHHTGSSSDQISVSLNALVQTEITDEIFGDRKDEAVYLMAQTIQQMESMLEGRKAQEQLAAQLEAQRIENARIAAVAAAKQAEAERVQREALQAEAERQRVQAEELAKQRAELEEMQRKIAAHKAAEEAKAEAAIAAERAKIEAEAKAAAAESERARVAEITRLEQEAKETQELVDAQDSKGKENFDKHHPSLARMKTEAQQLAQSQKSQPNDYTIINEIAVGFDVSYDTACDWILSVAENLRSAA